MNSRISTAVKRPANVSIRLDELVRRKERDAWIERNRAAIEAYNERVEREGVFSHRLRTF